MKLPFFQFYPGDWLKDTRHLSPAAKGLWIDAMVSMWDSPTRGTIVNTILGYARIVGASAEQAKALIDELTDPNNPVADRENLPDGRIKLSCRRMVREEADRQAGRDRVKRFRSKETQKQDCNDVCNAPVTRVSDICSMTSEISLPDNVPENLRTLEFAEAWHRWGCHLTDKRKPLTIYSQDLQLATLSKMGVAKAIETINYNIVNNTQGLYEPRPQYPSKPTEDKREQFVSKSEHPDQLPGLKILRAS